MLQDQGQFVTVFTNEFDVEEMICVWGFDSDFGNVVPTAALAHDAYDAFANRLLPVMTNQYRLIRLEMELMVPGGVMSAQWQEDQQGAVAQDAVPQNTAYLIHKISEGIGTGKNGRCYLPGVREDNVSSAGRLEGSWPNTVSDSVTQLVTDFDGDPLPRLVVNRGLRVDPSDPPPRQPTVTPEPIFWVITSIFCDQTVATQRRRLRPR